MESSLRNHALVHLQNQQKQSYREDYYHRSNNGIIRPSSANNSASNANINANINANSNRCRISGSCASGKGSRSSGNGSGSGSSRSRSTRSGEASDEAVQLVTESNAQHRYHSEHHQQQQQQQQYYYHHQQHQQQQQQQQTYPQHHQYYSGAKMTGLPQQQQMYDQYGYPVHRDGISSSQQSSSHHRVYMDHQQQQQQQYGGHAGGSATEAGSQSHYSNILGSIGGSVMSNPSVEEAYRRVGLRLSLSVHGGDSDVSRSSAHRIRKAPSRLVFASPSSSFKPFKEVLQQAIREREKEDALSNGSGSNKSKKSINGNIIKKMTVNANELFRLLHTEHSRIQPSQQRRRRKSGNGGRNTSRPSSRTSKMERSSSREEMSPHHRLAQMTLRDGSRIHGHNNALPSSSKKQTGSLSAVIESASQNSSTATRSTTANSRRTRGRGDEDKSRTSSTIATDNSMGTRNSLRSFGTLPPRGSCLTQPSEGVSNENLCDNVEGNLIVHENDNIHVPRKQVCVLTQGKIPKGAPSSDFRVQSLLGQGTFAQVFRCLHVQTGQLVAIKIVKNRPAYTRQAAVEIDVIRALTTTTLNETTNTDRDDGGTSPHNKNSCDYMIDLVCYFLYKDHLCLVFELLGLNLYEVLKKRQFRGLPLSVTQTLVRQAVLGARTLAKKNIVHSDLKPENILLIDEDDSESVTSAGESRRVHASSSSLNANTTSSNPNDKKQTDSQTFSAGSTKSNPKIGSPDGSNKSSDNEGQTLMGVSDSTNVKANQQEDKTQTEQTHLSDNSKSTTETYNTMQNIEERKTNTKSQNCAQEKGNARTSSVLPMESMIATYEKNEMGQHPASSHQIKLIDFGSACFEGQMSHTYIQSRFYRSPEVLLGLAYDSAIDMWSLGCVAAELFLGLPILPGVHEHDQLLRIIEMIGDTPDWMLDQGTKSAKYFMKFVPAATPAPSTLVQSSATTSDGRSGSTEAVSGRSESEGPRPLPRWRIKTKTEYISSLSHSDIEKKGGLAKLQKQPGNRYFRRKILSDIIFHKGHSGKQEDPHLLKAFVHFLYGILDPDPWKRWTAFQVASHPFFTGATMKENVDPSKIKDGNHANRLFNFYWEAPTDPAIYRRKLLNVQKTREKQQAARRGLNRGHSLSRSRSASPSSQDGLPTFRHTYSSNNHQGEDLQSSISSMDEASNQGSARLLQGSYQGAFNMSSSMTQFGVDHGIRLSGSSFGAHPGFSGPLSFSASGNSLALPGSFNEVDFALALHRPGVVPMGDSLTSATTSTTSMSSGNNSRSTYNQNSIQISQVGSPQVLHYTNQERRFPTGSVLRTSRSLNEGELAPADPAAIPTLIDSRLQQVIYSSSQEPELAIGPPLEFKPQVESSSEPRIESKDENFPDRPASATSAKAAGNYPEEETPPITEDTKIQESSKTASNPNCKMNPVQPTQSLGVYENPQAYQQQFVAMQQQFQQQQLLLQQQQATLALQQEQLRVYYSNMSNATGIKAQQYGIPGTRAAALNAQQFGLTGDPATPSTIMNAHQFGIPGAQATPSAVMNTQQFGLPTVSAAAISDQQLCLTSNTPGAVQAAALNPQQFGLTGAAAPFQGAGYYVVTNADGTQMIVPPNQGVTIPMPGQVAGIAPIPNIMPGQFQASPAVPAQIQGISPVGLTSNGSVPPGVTTIPGMSGIKAMQAGGIIPPTGSVPGVGPAGIPSMNSNPIPSPGGIYSNNNTNDHHHRHRHP